VDLVLRARANAALFRQAIRVREQPTGYAFAFPAETTSVQSLLEFITAERACCPYFTFQLTFPSPHRFVWLTVRGRQGVKDLVREAFVSLAPGR
jgi:hypothetical protein